MSTPRQLARAGIWAAGFARRVPLALLLALLSLCASPLRAQTAPPGTVGRLEGLDISIQNGPMMINGTGQPGAGLFVANGSVVTIHSGHARMTLLEGGQVGICGPAKFTLLQSGTDITLALDFGRVQVDLPVKSSLRVFTPTIIATPLDISGGARDVAVGLNLDDSLCVRAASGAIQLEHQFSGEKLIVPQQGEFFLNGGKLLPVAGTPGTCECDASDSTPIVVPAPSTPPKYAVVITRPSVSARSDTTPLPAPDLGSAQPAATLAPTSPTDLPKPPPEFDLKLLAQASQAHPVDSPKNIVQEQPPTEPAAPLASVSAVSPLTYMAPNLQPPLDPGPDMILLIRQAQVSPEYEFTGHVAPPEFAVALQHALGQGGANSSKSRQTGNLQPPRQEKKEGGGFWGSLKRLFGGG